MEQKLTLGQRFINAFTNKSAYELPPEIFDSSRTRFKLKIFNDFFGYNAGGKYTMRAYMKALKDSPLVFLVVNRIAKTTSTIKSLAVDPDDHDKELATSKLLEFLKTPNPKQNGRAFFRDIYAALGAAGNVFIYKQEIIGLEDFEASFCLKVWTADKVDIKTNDSGVIIGYEYTDAFNVITTVGPEDLDDVLHIHFSNVCQYEENSAYYGLSPVEAMWIVIQSSDEKFNAEASIFKNRGIIGILTNDSDAPILPKERERMQDELNNDIGGSEKFNQIHISNNKLRYLQTGMTPTDLKLLEGITSSLRLYCAAYGMPSVLFNDNENSTYNNVREAKITAYEDAYLPMFELVSDELSPWLSMHLGVDEYLKPDLTKIAVLRNTTNKIMRNLNSLEPSVARSVVPALQINDARTMLGAEPLAEGGEELIGAGAKQTEETNGETGSE